MSTNLTFLAGRKACTQIKEGGLSPADIALMAGAAGGPKWIALHGMDRALFDTWFEGRKEPLPLIGSSVGCWRFAACISHESAAEGLAVLKDAYFRQVYDAKPSAAVVSEQAWSLLSLLLHDTSIPKALAHPFGRLHMIAVRAKGLVASEQKWVQTSGVLSSMLCNAVNRSTLRWYFDRVVIRDPRDQQQHFEHAPFATSYADLTVKNLPATIMASSAIPIVMKGVHEIDGLPKGTYRDGGILDYHMAMPYRIPDGKIALLPHFFEQVKTGWFDKHLPYRKPNPKHMEQVLVICPSADFIAQLHGGKVPDRKDFERLPTAQRLQQWESAYAKCLGLGEELLEVLESGRIRELVQLGWE